MFNLEQSEQELTGRLLKQEKEVVLLKGEMKEQEEMLNHLEEIRRENQALRDQLIKKKVSFKGLWTKFQVTP